MKIEKQSNWLYKCLLKFESNLNDPYCFIYEYFYTIRNKIDLRLEYALLDILNKEEQDEKRHIHEEMIEKLSKLQNECMDNIKAHDEQTFESFRDRIDKLKKELDLIEFETALNLKIESFEDWERRNNLKLKFNSIKNEYDIIRNKLQFILLMGFYVVFKDKTKTDESYIFNSDKIKIYSVNDYKVDSSLTEKIYIYEVNLLI